MYVFLHVMLRQLEDGVRNGALLGSTSTTIAMPRRLVAFTPCPEGRLKAADFTGPSEQ